MEEYNKKLSIHDDASLYVQVSSWDLTASLNRMCMSTTGEITSLTVVKHPIMNTYLQSKELQS